MCINIWWEEVKKKKKNKQCPAKRHEAMGINWNSIWKKRKQTKRQNKQNTHPKITNFCFLLWGCSNTGTSCPERLWSLHLWRHSKLNWTWPWATCSSCPCLSREIQLDDLLISLPIPNTYWFWHLFLVITICSIQKKNKKVPKPCTFSCTSVKMRYNR